MQCNSGSVGFKQHPQEWKTACLFHLSSACQMDRALWACHPTLKVAKGLETEPQKTTEEPRESLRTEP